MFDRNNYGSTLNIVGKMLQIAAPLRRRADGLFDIETPSAPLPTSTTLEEAVETGALIGRTDVSVAPPKDFPKAFGIASTLGLYVLSEKFLNSMLSEIMYTRYRIVILRGAGHGLNRM